MLFTGPIYSGENRYVHTAVYGVVENIPEFQELSKNPRCWVGNRVRNYDPNNDLSRAAARISYIYTRVTNNWLAAIKALSGSEVPVDRIEYLLRLDDVVIPSEIPKLTEEQMRRCLKGLYNLLHCTPNQGVGISPVREGNCDLYRLCPFCRYKKTRELFLAFEPHLSEGRELAVTSFLTPMDELHPGYPVSSDVHSVIGKAIRSKREWICDVFITQPFRKYFVDSEPEMFWKSSLVAVKEEGAELSSIEDLCPNEIKGAEMISEGVSRGYNPTLAGLSTALRPVMGYPGWLLRHEHDKRFMYDLSRILIPTNVFKMAFHGMRVRERQEVAQGRLDSSL